MHYTYVDIGTADFDTAMDVKRPEDAVLLVEPLFEYLARLPNGPNVFKANFAVSNERSMARIYYVPPEKILEYNLPDWVRGCNSFNKVHPTITRLLNSRPELMALTKLVAVCHVRVITFDDLVDLYDISSLTHLKIDTEGHDHAILFSVLEVMHKRRLFPDTLTFEYQPQDQFGANILLDELGARFALLGYARGPQHGDNVTLTRQSLNHA